jgi:hypothetical protein
MPLSGFCAARGPAGGVEGEEGRRFPRLFDMDHLKGATHTNSKTLLRGPNPPIPGAEGFLSVPSSASPDDDPMTDTKESDQKLTLRNWAKDVHGREENRGEDLRRAEAYQHRVQALGDFVNAYPVPDGPRLALGAAASLAIAGSYFLEASQLYTFADVLAAVALYFFAGVIGAYSLYSLWVNHRKRERRWHEARQMFWQWACKAEEPYKAGHGKKDGTIEWWPSDLP